MAECDRGKKQGMEKDQNGGPWGLGEGLRWSGGKPVPVVTCVH